LRDRWRATPYLSEEAFPDSGRYGSGSKAASFLWLATLSDAVNPDFCEGVTVLDYGCGHGRYARFMQERLRWFSYYGLEKDSEHGRFSIAEARSLFDGDSRIQFDFTGSELEQRALACTNVGILGSVLTHVPIDEAEYILQKMFPVTERGGVIVASVFYGEEYGTFGPGMYGHGDCFSSVVYTRQQIAELALALGMSGVEKESFADGAHIHHVLRMTARVI
jgi:SAM-dependent methyltransferase